MATSGTNKTIGGIHRNTGISKSHVSRILKGTRRPSIHAATLMARDFGISVDEFIQSYNLGCLKNHLSSLHN